MTISDGTMKKAQFLIDNKETINSMSLTVIFALPLAKTYKKALIVNDKG